MNDNEYVINDSDSDTDPEMPELETINYIYYIKKVIEEDPIFGKLSEYEIQILGRFIDLINDEYISIPDIEILKNDLYNERCRNHISIDLLTSHKLFNNNNNILVIDAILFKEKMSFSTISYYTLDWTYPKRKILDSEIENINKISTDDSLLNSKKSEGLNNVSPQKQSLFCNIPDELLINIIIESLPYETMDFRTFFRIRYVCKRFYNAIHNNFFIDKLIKSFHQPLKKRIAKTVINLDKIEFTFFSRVIYEYIHNIIKNHIIITYGKNLINVIGGFDKFIKLPSIYMDSKCIDNLCGCSCINTFHSILNSIDNPIVKGVDDKQRPFVLFIYQNTTTKQYFFEFIYKNSISNNVTYSGINFDTYIGNKSTDYTCGISTSYRHLKYKSYDYIDRLVKGKDVGVVSYKHNMSEATEDFSCRIILNYNKKEIKQQIINTFNQRYLDEFNHSYTELNCFI
tara:strand:- start:1799 stop:3169 length:1371 start_codon:yes stop_codon:yes gene_type:complete